MSEVGPQMGISRYKRIFVVVLDAVGTGAAPDALKYDDLGADTLGHLSAHFRRRLALPNLQRLGLGNLRQAPLQGVPAQNRPAGYYGQMRSKSLGKENIDGYWEMMGLPITREFDVFPNGFPVMITKQLVTISGHELLINRAYSVVKAVYDYGEEQLASGRLIICAGSDSVLRIIAHEDVVSSEELATIGRRARHLLDQSPYRVSRVVVHSFNGHDRQHFRFTNQESFIMTPPAPTVLDRLTTAGYQVTTIGKASTLFVGKEISQVYLGQDNETVMDNFGKVFNQDFLGLCLTGLSDFDWFGHRRDPEGFGQSLMAFDRYLGEILTALREDDLIVLTAGHGNDPDFRGTAHTREFVPLLAYSPSLRASGNLGTRGTLADLGETILANFGLAKLGKVGQSFLEELK